jgi:hypothetical protein
MSLKRVAWGSHIRKGDHISGIDPESREGLCYSTPRRDAWNEHFTWTLPEAPF